MSEIDYENSRTTILQDDKELLEEEQEYIHEHHEHMHKHIHSDEDKRNVINRLARAIGHMESVKRMVENDEDCSEVLIQLSAVRSAITNTGKVVLKNHMNHCIIEAVKEEDNQAILDLEEAIDKFMK